MNQFTLDPALRALLVDLGLDVARGLRRAGQPVDLLARRTWTPSPGRSPPAHARCIDGSTIETEAKKNPNATFESGPRYASFAIRDGRLITAQQQNSTRLVRRPSRTGDLVTPSRYAPKHLDIDALEMNSAA